MSDYLTNLVLRSFEPVETIRPRMMLPFEPPRAGGPILGADFEQADSTSWDIAEEKTVETVSPQSRSSLRSIPASPSKTSVAPELVLKQADPATPPQPALSPLASSEESERLRPSVPRRAPDLTPARALTPSLPGHAPAPTLSENVAGPAPLSEPLAQPALPARPALGPGHGNAVGRPRISGDEAVETVSPDPRMSSSRSIPPAQLEILAVPKLVQKESDTSSSPVPEPASAPAVPKSTASLVPLTQPIDQQASSGRVPRPGQGDAHNQAVELPADKTANPRVVRALTMPVAIPEKPPRLDSLVLPLLPKPVEQPKPIALPPSVLAERRPADDVSPVQQSKQEVKSPDVAGSARRFPFVPLLRPVVTTPVEKLAAPLQRSPVVQVTIGRIEVRAQLPPASQPQRKAGATVMSLEEYLRRRKEGGSP